LFGYHDAQLYRVGTNHQHLPVNSPRCPLHNQQRDGAMAIKNGGSVPNYATVQADGTGSSGFGHGDNGWALSGTAGRYDGRGQEDDTTQAGNLFRLLPADERQKLFDNMAGPLSQVSAEIQARMFGHLDKADAAYGAGVRAAIAARKRA
jgi:catalase